MQAVQTLVWNQSLHFIPWHVSISYLPGPHFNIKMLVVLITHPLYIESGFWFLFGPVIDPTISMDLANYGQAATKFYSSYAIRYFCCVLIIGQLGAPCPIPMVISWNNDFVGMLNNVLQQIIIKMTMFDCLAIAMECDWPFTWNDDVMECVPMDCDYVIMECGCMFHGMWLYVPMECDWFSVECGCVFHGMWVCLHGMWMYSHGLWLCFHGMWLCDPMECSCMFPWNMTVFSHRMWLCVPWNVAVCSMECGCVSHSMWLYVLMEYDSVFPWNKAVGSHPTDSISLKPTCCITCY